MTYQKILIVSVIILVILFFLFNFLNYKIVIGLMLILAILIVISTIIAVANYSGEVQPRNKWTKKVMNLEYTEDFNNFILYVKENYGKKLEKLRIILIMVRIISIIVFFSLLVMYIWGVSIIERKFGINILEGTKEFSIFLLFFGIGYIYIGIHNKYINKYQTFFKENVIKNLILVIDKNLAYNNIENKLETEYKEANFIEEKYSTFVSNDYISGNVDGVNMEISDALLGISKDKINYKRLFSFSKINKIIPSEIRISNNKVQNVVRNKVNLDSTEFEKNFDVLCDFNILAVRILTHDIMEEMIGFYKNVGLSFEMVIKDDNIYIKYDVGDIFEAELFRNSLNKKTLWIFYNVMKFSITITKKMNEVLSAIEV